MPSPGFAPERPPSCRRPLVDHDGLRVDDVRCAAGREGWSEPEATHGYAFILARSGCFARRANGREALVDATVGYFNGPGEEQQMAHPADCGDRCTSIAFAPALLAWLWGGDPDALPGTIFVTPAIDLMHRRLLAQCRAGAAAGDVEELVVGLTATALAQQHARRVDSGRPASAAARRRIVSAARHLLAVDPTRTLGELARELAVSPHHLSRIFAAATGAPVTTYRNRLRVRAALERIADGERSLTRLAAELGFSDHAHLTRTIRSETGMTPSAHRRLWSAPR